MFVFEHMTIPRWPALFLNSAGKTLLPWLWISYFGSSGPHASPSRQKQLFGFHLPESYISFLTCPTQRNHIERQFIPPAIHFHCPFFVHVWYLSLLQRKKNRLVESIWKTLGKVKLYASCSACYDNVVMLFLPHCSGKHKQSMSQVGFAIRTSYIFWPTSGEQRKLSIQKDKGENNSGSVL